jgi:hypothetical protein
MCIEDAFGYFIEFFVLGIKLCSIDSKPLYRMFLSKVTHCRQITALAMERKQYVKGV